MQKSSSHSEWVKFKLVKSSKNLQPSRYIFTFSSTSQGRPSWARWHRWCPSRVRLLSTEFFWCLLFPLRCDSHKRAILSLQKGILLGSRNNSVGQQSNWSIHHCVYELCEIRVSVLTDELIKKIFKWALGIIYVSNFSNPNGLDDSVNDLSVHWQPITKENPTLNFVFTSNEPKMCNDLFDVCFFNA